MAENSKIEWTDHTFNPWTGCTKVSPGCDHCYAEGWAKRSGTVRWGAGEPRRRTTDANWRLPVKWNQEARAAGKRARVFCSSLADVFDNEVPDEWRCDLFDLIDATPHLDWLLLTKRIGNAKGMIERIVPSMIECDHGAWPWPHVWIGSTVVNQTEADRDIPKLLQVPARVRFLSIEPMLGPVRLHMLVTPNDRVIVNALTGQSGEGFETQLPLNQRGLDWIICGGESGPGARPMHPDWARSLRDQCKAAGVPFLFKQWGEWGPTGNHPNVMGQCVGFEDGSSVIRVGKKLAGRLLDGVQHDGFPEVA